jgi:protein phosphatase
LAIKFLVNLVLATPDWVLRLDDDADAERIVHRTVERFEQASQALTHEADLKPGLQGFGTTLTLAAILNENLFVFHVGDSRAYLFRKNHLHQLTRDHTRAQELVDAGVIEQNDAATHRWRNQLTRLLGDQAPDARPDVQRLSLSAGDCLLLCTDGLTEMLDDQKIVGVLQRASSASVACRSLIADALAAGGNDNVTVVVARFEAP